MDKPRDRIELTDPRALRALAHPIRLQLVGLLRRMGPLTATRTAQLLDESTASTSFHLRQLAKYGLVEEAGGGTGRQRPWRPTARATSWPTLPDTPEMGAATDALTSIVADFYRSAMLRWIAARDAEPESWRAAAPFGDAHLYLRADELASVAARIEAIFAEYRDRTAEEHPAGTRGVMYLNVALPVPPDEDRP